MRKFHWAVATLALLAAASSCKEGDNGASQSTTTASSGATGSGSATTPSGDASATGSISGGVVTTSSGLKYEDLKVGDGTLAERGNRVSVHYTGWLTDGTKFDSSLDRDQPFQFRLGEGQVIRGWDEGVAGMR